MHTAQCLPVVGGIHTVVLPAGSVQSITVAPATSLVVPVAIGKHGALVISVAASQPVYLCSGVMTAFGVAPEGQKLWGVATIFGTLRVIVPEHIQSLGFRNPGTLAATYFIWLEDQEPAKSLPFQVQIVDELGGVR